jgi:hypothetical protein
LVTSPTVGASIKLMRVFSEVANSVAAICPLKAVNNKATFCPVVTATPLVPPAGSDSTPSTLTQVSHRRQVVAGFVA